MGTKMILLFVLIPLTCQANLNVVTSTSDLAAIASEVGGSNVSVEPLCKGSQDPHALEAKPSYMLRVSKADLLVSIGLDLEIGWLPSIIQGARNPRVTNGSDGFLEIGPLVDPLEVLASKGETVSRAQGDVHPYGNPHVTLDPIRAAKIGKLIGARLAKLDPTHANAYSDRAIQFETRLSEKVKQWQSRLFKTDVKKVVTYHKTLTYFFDRFHIENPAILEPKPGIPPTAKHLLSVLASIKEQNIPLVLIENYFDPSVASRLRQDIPSLRIKAIPVAVGGETSVNSLEALYEKIVASIEAK